MQIINDIKICQDFSFKHKQLGKTIGVIPTMGGLHGGHLALIEKAQKSCDIIIVTIFVNPLQFGKKEDLNSYPTQLDNDINICRKKHIDAIFTPTIEEMYGHGMTTFVNEKSLTNKLCGLSRQGHFKGVTTVVAKLFNATLPHKAFFGEKDYQQLCIIKRMTEDLNFPIKIIAIPIIRAKDGLALSTRNQYLSCEERQIAPFLFKELTKVKELIIQKGHLKVEETTEAIKLSLQKNTTIDYIKICHYQTLEPLAGQISINEGQLFIAVFLGKTRLIDNIFLGL